MKAIIKATLFFVAILSLLGASACAGFPGFGTNASRELADEVTFYNWVSDVPQEVLDEFTASYGVKVNYVAYESQEEAIENMRSGQVFDVIVFENQFLPALIEDGLLHELVYDNLPNTANIVPNFRDFPIDPGRKHSIPYNWGTTGLVVRIDKMEKSVTSWNDLWEQEKIGKVLLWRGLPRHMIGVTLKSLGYSANSENPAEIESALQKLIALKANALLIEDIDPNLESSAPLLLEGQGVMAVGWNYDVLEAREQNPDVVYVLPEEGALLWQDNFVIPANSKNTYTAEVFLNFLLQPEISAKITNFNYYPNSIEKSKEFIHPEILFDPIIYPSAESLKMAETIYPLSEEGEALYTETWQRFLDAP